MKRLGFLSILLVAAPAAFASQANVIAQDTLTSRLHQKVYDDFKAKLTAMQKEISQLKDVNLALGKTHALDEALSAISMWGRLFLLNNGQPPIHPPHSSVMEFLKELGIVKHREDANNVVARNMCIAIYTCKQKEDLAQLTSSSSKPKTPESTVDLNKQLHEVREELNRMREEQKTTNSKLEQLLSIVQQMQFRQEVKDKANSDSAIDGEM